MSSLSLLYALVGLALFCLGLYALIANDHLLRKILALNVTSNGIFMVLVAFAKQGGQTPPDAVPHAMVITGIVVAVSATAMALTLMLKLTAETGQAKLDENQTRSPK